MNPDEVIDTSGMSCPMPVLATKRALEALGPGRLLKVLATDPGTKTDIPALAEKLGHEFIMMMELTDVIEFYIRKR